MLLPGTNARLGATEQDLPVDESAIGRSGLCITGRPEEPPVSAEFLAAAIREDEVETLRPLLPVGYEAVAQAYRRAVSKLNAADLSSHYTNGLAAFHQQFVPYLKEVLRNLTGGAWNLADFEAYAAGSDVDMITHIVEAVAAREQVCLFPGDWFGFRVGSTQGHNIIWDRNSSGRFACVCVPSVRNGHFTEEMSSFLDQSQACLLNLNLLPTLTAPERHSIALRLSQNLHKSIISISFSRGFGLTASQLGVVLVHPDHPLRHRFKTQWNWFTYFYNALAASAFMEVDFTSLQAEDERRRAWVADWLRTRGLPVVESGSYYAKSFELLGQIPDRLAPLVRDNVARLCFKPDAS